MDFLPENINNYAERHTQPESALLQSLNRETHAEILKPRMLSGHLQGRLLALWSQMMQPNYILEIGTFTGYSALCLAEGLAPNGRLITLEANEELAPIIRKYFGQSPQKNQLELIIGDAALAIPMLPNEIDLVFIDADKKSYAKYYDMVFEKVRKNGIIIADNVLWSGKVAQAVKIDKDTQTLIDFNAKVLADKRVEKLLLPLRDGLMIARKLI